MKPQVSRRTVAQTPKGRGRVPEDRRAGPLRQPPGGGSYGPLSSGGASSWAPSRTSPWRRRFWKTSTGCVPPAYPADRVARTPRGRVCVPTFKATIRPRDKLQSFMLTLGASAIERPLPCWRARHFPFPTWRDMGGVTLDRKSPRAPCRSRLNFLQDTKSPRSPEESVVGRSVWSSCVWLGFPLAQSWTGNGTRAAVRGRLASSSQETALAETFGHALSPTSTALIKKRQFIRRLTRNVQRWSRARLGPGPPTTNPFMVSPSPCPPPPSLRRRLSFRSAEFSCSTSQAAAGPGLSRAPSS